MENESWFCLWGVGSWCVGEERDGWGGVGVHMQNQRTLGRLRCANGQGHVMAMDDARRGNRDVWMYVCM